MHNLFEGAKQVILYAKHRPKTPQYVAEKVLSYMKKRNSSPDFMIDVGCGSGLSTELFASHFKKIIGIDSSSKQIDMANKHKEAKNIVYQVGIAEKLPAPDNSVDLIASGEAVHWFDLPNFFKECHRVLKSNGCLALHGYNLPRPYPVDHLKFYSESDLLNMGKEAMAKFVKVCRTHPCLVHVHDHYERIFNMISSNHKVREDDLRIEIDMTLADYRNYLHSWSGYQTYLKEKRANLINVEGNDDKLYDDDVLNEFAVNAKKMWKLEDTKDEVINLKVVWHYFIILSEKPSGQLLDNAEQHAAT